MVATVLLNGRKLKPVTLDDDNKLTDYLKVPETGVRGSSIINKIVDIETGDETEFNRLDEYDNLTDYTASLITGSLKKTSSST